VYDIRAAGAEAPRGCFVKDNSPGWMQSQRRRKERRNGADAIS